MPTPRTLTLDQGWTLHDAARPEDRLAASLPLDVHQVLLENGRIPDPFYRDQEDRVQWVHQRTWVLESEFELTAHDLDQAATLRLEFVDTHASVAVNGQAVGEIANFFRRFHLNVGTALRAGSNRLTITLHDNAALGAKRAAELPFPVPYSETNNRIPHMNTVRKTQCDAGWDWGICLMSTGVYVAPTLWLHRDRLLDSVRVEQHNGDGEVRLAVTVDTVGAATTEQSVAVSLTDADPVTLTFRAGENRATADLRVIRPRLWWPAGYGDQPLYRLEARLDDQRWHRDIGLRSLHWDLSADDAGNRMCVVVNGVDIFAKGANWIPADAFPARHTRERYERLLGDAVAANMNMVRVWGGGF